MTAQRFEKKLFKPGGLAEAVQLVFFSVGHIHIPGLGDHEAVLAKAGAEAVISYRVITVIFYH